jgi:hypothetical protein
MVDIFSGTPHMRVFCLAEIAARHDTFSTMISELHRTISRFPHARRRLISEPWALHLEVLPKSAEQEPHFIERTAVPGLLTPVIMRIDCPWPPMPFAALSLLA